MQKPDFGNVRRIEWNDDRVAWVRRLAEDKSMTAQEIALDIGQAANQAPRLFELCKRRDISLTGTGGRPRRGEVRIAVGVPAQYADVLTSIAQRHRMPARRIVELLLNAVLEAGETFCTNLMDLTGNDARAPMPAAATGSAGQRYASVTAIGTGSIADLTARRSVRRSTMPWRPRSPIA
ncbi:hypothetical protein [Bradyrhizobium arachidis]|uniref:hypothetical protein n=1 Tax=Bradyrhizobium arachidis TaxID=858423 RepID=UPI00216392FE|nr:hypothetical protein [Bradyrhizobium arachidis]UVO30515.1 hypothetical protein KUF59_07525 [Bradyrhizobium arachidis]